MSLISVEDGINFIKGENANQGPKVNFRKIDQQIYRDNKNTLENSGFNLKDLKELYSSFNFNSEYSFGKELRELPKAVYTGERGSSSIYIDKRIDVLNDIIKMIQSAKDPKDLNKITALMELSKEAAGDNQIKAAHYIELRDAAKEAVSENPQAKKDLKDYEKGFIYDKELLEKTVGKLIEKRDHLQAIKDQGYNTSEYGIAGNVADGSLKFAGQTMTAATTLNVMKSIPHVKESFVSAETLKAYNINNLDELEIIKQAHQKMEKGRLTTKIGNRIINSERALQQLDQAGWTGKLTRGGTHGAKTLGKGFWKYATKGLDMATNFLPGPLKFIGKVVIGTVTAGAALAHVAVAMKKNPDTLGAMGKAVYDTAGDIFVGETGGVLQTALSYVIPDLPGLIGGKDWSMYGKWSILPDWMQYKNDGTNSQLNELKNKYSKEGVVA